MPQNKTPKAEIASGVFYLYGRSEVGDRTLLQKRIRPNLSAFISVHLPTLQLKKYRYPLQS